MNTEILVDQASKVRTVMDMENGQWAKIEKLVGDEWLCIRLMELGFTAGECIRRVVASPFNDPVVVNVRGTAFALRSNEATCICVSSS